MKWSKVAALETREPVVIMNVVDWLALFDELERVRYERDELRDALASSHDACAGYRAAEVRAERGACARLAADPYGDVVMARAGDEPAAVGQKISAAILARGNK